ncbi:predicted protein [Pyrenophora tritici-repentis Pt-1C-BFP]|uniref:Uncharacterized protein n=1 Tax=Pyrenophora tritici-repentis (strain Pt-1C-BFP) TaxID=426418 RepID=B2W703_PYRTR|nr:uncharacterized protein PTRG_05591 [Pyrenophora tritici-repentis Pt-1C-BFP]EDU48511.1 predicted protein [Pyrenophora tritici-repentis Pt-1C-BFP]
MHLDYLLRCCICQMHYHRVSIQRRELLETLVPGLKVHEVDDNYRHQGQAGKH